MALGHAQIMFNLSRFSDDALQQHPALRHPSALRGELQPAGPAPLPQHLRSDLAPPTGVDVGDRGVVREETR